MEIGVAKADGAVVIALTGDLASREDQSALSGLVQQKLTAGERVFVLDLSEVPYVSSLGIAILVATHVNVTREGGKLRLVNPRGRVASVLRMIRVADMWTTYATVAEALSAN